LSATPFRERDAGQHSAMQTGREDTPPRDDAHDDSGVQPDAEASSDGDGSWTDDPQTQDPDEDRSVDAVVERTAPDGLGDTPSGR
jgi:hypothetical protein